MKAATESEDPERACLAVLEAAIEQLLQLLGVSPAAARIDPSRTLIQLDSELWTLVGAAPAPESGPPSLRRAGAKHKRVR